MSTVSHDSQKLEAVSAEISTPPKTAKRPSHHAFSSLNHANFRLFWFGQLISLIGTWMQTTAQSWLVLELTGSAWLLGVVGALQFLPVMLMALFGGVIADRFPKRRILLFTQSFAMVQAAVLWALVATGKTQIWQVMVLALLLGCTNALDMPTRQAFVSEMVGRKDLPNAIALNSSLFNMARIVGPGIGGLLIARLGIAPLFLMNAISFIAVLIGLILINPKKLFATNKPLALANGEPKPTMLQSIREGLSYAMRTPSISLIIIIVGTISLIGINFNVILPLFATDVLHSGAEGFGFISSAFGLGSLFCALWLAWGNRRPNMSSLLIGTIVFSILEACFALSHWYVVSLVLIASVGFAQIAFSATANTTIQTVAPDHLRGRVMSLYMLVFAGSIPLGNLLTGGMAHLLGSPLTLLIEAGICLITAIVGWILRKPAEKNLAETLRIQK